VTSTVTRSGNRRHDHAALGAAHPRNARGGEQLGASKVEGSPASISARVVAGAATLAMWAAPTELDSRSQLDFDILPDEIDTLHAHTLGLHVQSPR
jgi:hypothetical protein